MVSNGCRLRLVVSLSFAWVVALQVAAAGGAEAQASPNGAQFQVNSYTTYGQFVPGVAITAEGGFVVVWDGYGSSGSDSSFDSVQGRRYAAGGAALGPEFQVNSYTTSFQSGPAVAVDPAGNFVVAWQSAGSGGTDTDSTSIQAQRYDGLFRDGFETGGTSRWTATSP